MVRTHESIFGLPEPGEAMPAGRPCLGRPLADLEEARLHGEGFWFTLALR
jgi:hypothetical protein